MWSLKTHGYADSYCLTNVYLQIFFNCMKKLQLGVDLFFLPRHSTSMHLFSVYLCCAFLVLIVVYLHPTKLSYRRCCGSFGKHALYSMVWHLQDAISGHGSTVAASSFTEDLFIPTEIRGYDYVIGDVRKGDQQGEDCMKNSCYQLGLDAPRKNTSKQERRAEFRACSAPSMHQGKYIRGKGITCSAR
uniref:Uncharacterized protein n=1 Tax=Triticum urartu TaxID=4572 RepID=A0A8R7QE28_TRIUA